MCKLKNKIYFCHSYWHSLAVWAEWVAKLTPLNIFMLIPIINVWLVHSMGDGLDWNLGSLEVNWWQDHRHPSLLTQPPNSPDSNSITHRMKQPSLIQTGPYPATHSSEGSAGNVLVPEATAQIQRSSQKSCPWGQSCPSGKMHVRSTAWCIIQHGHHTRILKFRRFRRFMALLLGRILVEFLVSWDTPRQLWASKSLVLQFRQQEAVQWVVVGTTWHAVV